MNSSATTATRPIAPSYPLSPADVATQAAASYVRPVRAAWGTCPECNGATGSGPHVCKPKATPSAEQRLAEIEAAWDATSQGLAEYKAWVAA